MAGNETLPESLSMNTTTKFVDSLPLALGESSTSMFAGGVGFIYMALVALQTGVQPAVTRLCVAPTVSGQSLVLMENAVSMLLAIVLSPRSAFAEWSVMESAGLVGPPAIMYAFRSFFKQAAYRRCTGVIFNVINQTKVVFCAIAAWMLLSEGQSFQQCLALMCAVAAGAMLVVPSKSTSDTEKVKVASSASGTLFALATATCSGIAAALSQVAMRTSSRPSTLFNFELALWGLPFVVLAGGRINLRLLLEGWQWRTFLPVALQAAGGLLVSAVVKLKGGVCMGLCTVVGIVVSIVADMVIMHHVPNVRQLIAVLLAGFSILAHQFSADQLLSVGPAVAMLNITLQ